jgi:hypothetical protein
MYYLGVVGAFFLILYADFLGTSGDFYRFMRRYGVIFYFTFTPLAQMIMVNQLFKLRNFSSDADIKLGAIRYQLTILVLILLLGLISVSLRYIYGPSFERENIVEWNYSLLLTASFAGSIVMWKNLRWNLYIEKDPASSR